MKTKLTYNENLGEEMRKYISPALEIMDMPSLRNRARKWTRLHAPRGSWYVRLNRMEARAAMEGLEKLVLEETERRHHDGNT